MATEYKLSYTASQIDEKLGKIDTLEEEIGQLSSQNANGLTTAQINALDGMFQVCAFIKTDVSAEYNAFKTAFGISDSGGGEEPDIPDEPDTPAVTLTSISAVYGGGEVAVGTALSDLTGIVVTAHYSDGTSATVTGYTLSGEIAEGSNTITVSYGGKSSTITVTGVEENSGEDAENNGWTDGVAYEPSWVIDGYTLNSTTGEPTENTAYAVSDYLPCHGASVFENGTDIGGIVAYDADKNYVASVGTARTYLIPVPRDAYYIRIAARKSYSGTKTTTPRLLPMISADTVWESGHKYILPYNPGVHISETGITNEGSGFWNSGYVFCYGATTLGVVTGNEYLRKWVSFYDAEKNHISGNVGNDSTHTIPDGAYYFVVSSADKAGNDKLWCELS